MAHSPLPFKILACGKTTCVTKPPSFKILPLEKNNICKTNMVQQFNPFRFEKHQKTLQRHLRYLEAPTLLVGSCYLQKATLHTNDVINRQTLSLGSFWFFSKNKSDFPKDPHGDSEILRRFCRALYIMRTNAVVYGDSLWITKRSSSSFLKLPLLSGGPPLFHCLMQLLLPAAGMPGSFHSPQAAKQHGEQSVSSYKTINIIYTLRIYNLLFWGWKFITWF